jgi:26S proteasome regulatory subunit N3
MVEEKNKEVKAEVTAPDNDKKAEVKKEAPLPPLEAAARRLERLLGGATPKGPTRKTAKSAAAAKEESLIITNPGKIVRRWLGSSSGAAGAATLADIASCAERVLDPSKGESELRGRALLFELAPVAMETTTEEKKAADGAAAAKPFIVVAHREVEAWLLSLAVRCLLQEKKFREAFQVAQQSIQYILSHLEGGSKTVASSGGQGGSPGSGVLNSPALFPLLGRLYRLRSMSAEHALGSAVASAEYLRQDLVHAHRMACLRRDVDTQATVLNLMLRDLLALNQVEQAQKLIANSTFPETASNNQLCRYLYYSGRVQAFRLEYTHSYANLSQSLRKAPTNTGLGFRIAVQRLVIIVQLLMGEIPERAVFFQPDMTKALEPYLKIAQAVRRGDLKVFEITVSSNASTLQKDETYTLISRLSHSVVKAGLRKLNTSYSRISLADVADRLSLPSAASAEFVVAKAVRDGVIDATIDHEKQYVQSHELVDVYATTEPMEAFHRRIAYCLTTHNEAMRGMRYRPDAYRKELEASRGKTSPEDDKTDEEKAQELEDEFEEEF